MAYDDVDLGLLSRANTWSNTQNFNGVVSINNGLRYNISPQTATTVNLTGTTPTYVECNASANAMVVNGLATTAAGYTFTIRKTDSSVNPVTFQPGAALETWMGTTFGTAGAVRLMRQGDSITVRTTTTSGVYALLPSKFNPLTPQPEPIYTNLTIPAGNTVSATGTGVANQQTAFTTGPTMGANSFYAGYRVLIKFWGYYTATAAVNVQPEVYAGGTSGIKLIDAGALGLPSTQANCRYDGEIWLKCRSAGTSGVIESYGRLIFMNPTANAAGALTFPVGTNGSANAVGSTTMTYDTTVSRLIQLTAAYSSATSGDTNTLVHLEAVGYPPSVFSS